MTEGEGISRRIHRCEPWTQCGGDKTGGNEDINSFNNKNKEEKLLLEWWSIVSQSFLSF